MQSIYRNDDIRKYRIEFVIFTLLCIGVIPFILYMKSRGDDLSFGDTCYVREHFHLYCPGCGGTRAVILLLKGRLFQSFICNPYPLYISVLMIRIWCTLFYDSFIAGKYRRLISPLSYIEAWGMILLSTIIFVTKNVLLICLHIDLLGDFAGRVL